MRRRTSSVPHGTLVLGLSAAVLVGAGTWLMAKSSRRPGARQRREGMPKVGGGAGVHVEESVTVLRSPEDLYAEWRDPRHWPDQADGTRSMAGGPVSMPDAEVVIDEPNRLIAWRSVGDDAGDEGSVRFTPATGGRGTEVKIILTYAPTGGRLGAAAASLVGAGRDHQVREGLRHFKQRMETGEVAVSGAPDDGEPLGRESAGA